MSAGLSHDTQPGSPLSTLASRILVHANPKDVDHIADLIDPLHSGIVLTSSSRNKSRRSMLAPHLHAKLPGAPILNDAGAYTRSTASLAQPFELASTLMGDTLEADLAWQSAAGSALPITPTRRIAAGDSEVLCEVLAQTERITQSDALCLLPLSVDWFDDDAYKKLDHALQYATGAIAITVIGSMDKLKAASARNRIRELLTNRAGLCMFRTDLAAFDALSFGGWFSSIGIRKQLRPPYRRLYKRRTGAASVLIPELMRWASGDELRHAAGFGEPITCDCTTCNGACLSRFEDASPAMRRTAERHNVATWMSWLTEFVHREGMAAKQQWWHAKCAIAVDAARSWDREHGGHVQDSPQLRFWAPR